MNCSTINSRFKKYALSYSGMDGGNLNAPLWICGIEFGESLTKDTRFQPVTSAPYWNQETRDASIEKSKGPNGCRQDRYTMWPFCRLASKLTITVLTGALSDWRTHYHSNPEQKGYCGKHSGNFSMNLFPISFRHISNTNWNEELRSKTGLSSLDCYYEWCINHRFPLLRSLVTEHKPAAIVCCGIGKRNNFAQAFCGKTQKNWNDRLFNKKKKSTKTLLYYKLQSIINDTTVWIVPFLGQGGLLSNKDIEELGNWVRSDIIERKGNNLNEFWH